MGGRLEHEIRLLPQVLSCSFSQDDYVVVLIDPSGDPWTIRLAVERILQNAGSEAAVRVIGRADATAGGATRTISPLVATATVASVAAIGIGSLVGGLAAVEHPKTTPSNRPPAATAAAAPLDTLDAFRGFPFAPIVREPAAERAGLPVEAPDQTQRAAETVVSAARTVTPRRTAPRVRSVQARSASEPTQVSNLGYVSHKRHGRHLGRRARVVSQSVFLPIRQHKEKVRDTR